ncbi:MAG: PDZ domain-containing protein [Firmicutes bacterium]|nr:PDZ domain-containing protein [Bacillota bacterium]HPU00383.1 PDZ domain-containing protein [Bacillota bacterium]
MSPQFLENLMPYVEIVKILLYTLFQALPLFWLVIVIVYMQYRRAAFMEQQLFGMTINPLGRQVAFSTLWGILGGLLASMLMILLGLPLTQIGLLFIWPVALLLLLIHPRYLCFSYAGGIVALAALLLRSLRPYFPALTRHDVLVQLMEIHIPALLALVGLLHLVEAMLIYTSGHRGSSPLYFKQPGGEVVGAFSLQRFWPIPLAALLATVVAESELQGVPMPEWWPLLEPALELRPGQMVQYFTFPAVAALGYSDLALSSTPREKSASTALFLSIFSLLLIGAALAAEYYPPLTLVGVLFAPLGHEAVIRIGNRLEQSRGARYRSSEEGVLLMAVLPQSAAARAGLQAGDLLLRVNGAPVRSDLEFLRRLDESYFIVFIEGSRKGENFSVVLNKNFAQDESRRPILKPPPPGGALASLWHRGAALGFIPAPSRLTPVYAQARPAAASGLLKKLWGRFTRRT